MILGESPCTASRSLPMGTDTQQPPVGKVGCWRQGRWQGQPPQTAPRRPDHGGARPPVGPPDLTPAGKSRCTFPT